MSFPFQSSSARINEYVTPASFHSRHAAVLSAQLRGTAPAPLTVDQAAALDRVERASRRVVDLLLERQRVAPPTVREPRYAVVTGWTSFFAILHALANCARELDGTGAEAQALRDTLFPSGVTFTHDDAGQVWNDSKLLLERIESEGLAPRLDALFSPSLRASIALAHTQLGASLGANGHAVATSRARLHDARARFSFAVSDYARALSIGIDPDDSAAVDRFVAALAPIDPLRATGKADEDDDDATDPVTPTSTTNRLGEPPPPFTS